METVAAMLNCEFTDHPVYDGLELQWFDDEAHGTGMLAFLSRRADRRVDYYFDPALRLDRSRYHLGGGTGAWQSTPFDVAQLRVAPDGVLARASLTDVDGRQIEVHVDDRDGKPRRRAGLLAPVSAAIAEPESLLLVWMPAFDLVHRTRTAPVLRIDGEQAAIGRLPGAGLHRRLLIKYAAPLLATTLGRAHEGALQDLPVVNAGADGTAVLTSRAAGHAAHLVLDPAMPDLTAIAPGTREQGRWHVRVDDVRLTGGSWSLRRDDGEVTADLDVTERWRPGKLPLLMRLVTTVMPVFRRWPTSYRWRGVVTSGTIPMLHSVWERTGTGGVETYVRRTGGG
ncbi:hypothetical protein ACO0LV_04365 [Pseudactinotalea sp. Z1739]|uniref:hypothetical protein n=1 Tax=Pseudactinotalea sp. Z1739 TaxID=3413028 RepID=UPI003C7A1D3F